MVGTENFFFTFLKNIRILSKDVLAIAQISPPKPFSQFPPWLHSYMVQCQNQKTGIGTMYTYSPMSCHLCRFLKPTPQSRYQTIPLPQRSPSYYLFLPTHTLIPNPWSQVRFLPNKLTNPITLHEGFSMYQTLDTDMVQGLFLPSKSLPV